MIEFDKHHLKFLSKDKFLEFGMDNIAYIKPVRKDGELFYLICAANGTPLVELSQEPAARAAVEQYEMMPHSVH